MKKIEFQLKYNSEDDKTVQCSLSSIGSYCFYECSSIIEIILPNSLISIDDGTFEKCVNLEHILIPNSVELIRNNAFKKCESFKKVIISDESLFENVWLFGN